MRQRSLVFCLLATLCALSLPTATAAQETTGTIIGTVTDNSGGVLPGVTVVIKHLGTGQTIERVTSRSGAVHRAAPADRHLRDHVHALPGFEQRLVRGLSLSVNDRIVDGRDRCRSAASAKSWRSPARSRVQPTAALQTLIGAERVQELPLNNRNFVQLATLAPGVSNDLTDEVGTGLASTVSLSINGARRNAVNWLVDGVSNVDVGSNITLLSTPTLESIQEFKIITSSYAAEWPRSGGGIVNVVTKSGSNKFSGSGYEFFRNDGLNSNSYFRKQSTDPSIRDTAPFLRYNNFGYTVGGPLLPSREKAFFFFSEEWRRIKRAPQSAILSVPNPDWLTDPTSANYVAPADRDPNAVRLLTGFPTPNLAPATPGGPGRYQVTAPNINNTRQEVVRVDYDLSDKWRLTGRYTHDLSETRELQGLFFGTTSIPGTAATDTDVPGTVAAFSVKSILGGESPQRGAVSVQQQPDRLGPGRRCAEQAIGVRR